MRLVVDNGHSVLYGAPKALIEALRTVMSYKVKGAEFTPSYKAGTWDGRIRLLRTTKDRGVKFPTGLSQDALKVATNLGYAIPEIHDARRMLGERRALPWLGGIELRDYQHEAVEIAIGGDAVFDGRGILKLPMRSGKTVIAAALIRAWGRKSVFVATSQLILQQTAVLFRKIFGDVGVIGDREFSTGFITVASIQRLQRMDAPVVSLLEETDVLLVDEVHHMRGDSWREPILNADARYKIGLSATVKISRKESERSAVWLKSSTGPLLMDVPMGRLVCDGHIMPLDIIMIDMVGCGPVAFKSPYHTAYDKLIVENDARNRLIALLARQLVSEGHRVLVDTGRLVHIKGLYAMTRDVGVDASIIYGDVKSNKRAEIIKAFESGEKPVLIGTIMGEGVDVPVLSAVINAEGGKAYTSTMQRLRNLTQHPDKARAVLVDFIDSGNEYLREHSHERIRQYRQEPVFRLDETRNAADVLSELDVKS